MVLYDCNLHKLTIRVFDLEKHQKFLISFVSSKNCTSIKKLVLFHIILKLSLKLYLHFFEIKNVNINKKAKTETLKFSFSVKFLFINI